jgi:hypothetical protein
MTFAVSTSADARRQTTDAVVVTNWFAGDTAFEGFSKAWDAPTCSPAASSQRREYPTPTGEGRL